MYTEWKCSINKTLKKIKEYWVVGIGLLIWNVGVAIWFTFAAVSMWRIYGVQGSIADLLIFSQESWRFAIVLMAAVMLAIQKMDTTNANAQKLVNFLYRKKIWSEQWVYAISISIIITVVILGIQVLCGYLFIHELLNWGEQESAFFFMTNTTISVAFIEVLLVQFIMYFLKIFLWIALHSCCKWNKYGRILFWFLFVILFGVERRLEGAVVFYKLFTMPYTVWIQEGSVMSRLAVGMILMLLLWLIGKQILEKKDFYI